MDKVIGHVLVAVAGSAFVWFAHWCWKDIKREKRPEVTEEMVDEAFTRMLEEGNYIFDDD
jgi:hypothetical protein